VATYSEPGPTGTRSDDLRRWRSQFPDAVAIRDLRPRHSAVCVGVVHAVRLVPGRQLEITIEDDTGRLTALFVGRSRLPGLEMGSGLRFVGTLSVDNQGRRTMRNPDWALVAEPYA
jgi:hypothetical protein